MTELLAQVGQMDVQELRRGDSPPSARHLRRQFLGEDEAARMTEEVTDDRKLRRSQEYCPFSSLEKPSFVIQGEGAQEERIRKTSLAQAPKAAQDRQELDLGTIGRQAEIRAAFQG
ncbi:MAG: hypothetical protein PHO89_02150 [Methylacidiphilaceae bacterium]|nr:hypothetical protein [Candidatus Methylacidiphilaceae bacterium]